MTSWSTVAVLLVITWTDGLRSVGPDVLVLNWTLTNRWRPLHRMVASGWHLAALWPPIEIPLLLQAGSDVSLLTPSVADARFKRRLNRVMTELIVVRGLSLGLLLGIVLGIPWATDRHGAVGLLTGLVAVLLLTSTIATLVYATLRRGGLQRKPGLKRSAALMSPFSALGAPEVILTEISRGTPQLLVARHLLGNEEFARHIRVQAFDALIAPSESSRDRTIISLLGVDYLREVVARLPSNCRAFEWYCPRCATVYTADTGHCADCEGVAVLASGESP